MTPAFAADAEAIPLHLVRAEALEDWLDSRSASDRAWLDSLGFRAAAGALHPLPGNGGAAPGFVAGIGSPQDRLRDRFVAARAAALLPGGTYRLVTDLKGDDLDEAALGWLLADYRFDRYRDMGDRHVRITAPGGVDAVRLQAIAQGECLTRDLINTPASDMGPDALEAAARDVAQAHGASVEVIEGDALLAANFAMIHAVGRASDKAPRLIDMRWGDTGPTLTLVGKGVCFDTGGLDIKPAASMGLMKKDMGGAATVLGLAQTIMALGLPVQLRVLIPAVENAIDGSAFRPGDILTARNGLTVEINNTDAEGRLVLADALALASEDKPDLILSMATLTGAARVAVGPDIAPFFSTSDHMAAALSVAGDTVRDPVWRLPFHEPYETMLDPGIADLDNAPKGGFGGAITAALFLRRFTSGTYIHFDIYGWQPSSAPARPKGGVGQGARAILAALPEVLGY
ncbi:leucyl aminopeptidase family protein [Anianabacter salinae]|uniref:leucyl aminopeptidase family protein n=1 Tax=Anianabacter salinae TaxID=2851023 RepID=UPI00225DDDBC|nr:leucyl aminopeptidase family protein [Anianabacter salinae]MBV0913712.1 leucyl aminopeptidase family protein [Anianabacter salinae]